MKIFISFISSIILLLSLSSLAQESPLWLRYPAISPNGEMILFNYQGDIYKVPTKGGSAMPLTLSNSIRQCGVMMVIK
jgi:tricorn protease